MKNIYSVNYIDAMFQGFKRTSFYKSKKHINEKDFFEEINNKLMSKKDNNNVIYFFGNGASAAFSNHMALDFSKNGNILSRSLSDSSLLTALSNDYSYDDAMLEFLKIEKPSKNDFIITISSSGNSNNVVNVLDFASNKGIKSLSLCGLNENNKSIEKSDFSIYTPMKTYGMVECMHQVYLHLILDNFMGIEEWNKSESQNMDSSSFKL